MVNPRNFESSDSRTLQNLLRFFSPAGGTLDVFGRQRVAAPITLFDSTFKYDKQPRIWQEKITATASATHSPENSWVTLAVGSTANDKIVRQTFEHFLYQPGKSHTVIFTLDAGSMAAQNHLRFRAGLFDDDNGIFIEQYNGETRFVLRSNTSGAVVDKAILQREWSFDKHDGSSDIFNHSGIDLDMSKSQVLGLDFQWLGAGTVHCHFSHEAEWHLAHEFNHANFGSGAYMRTAVLPFRYEFENVDGGAVGTVKQGCQTVISEGGTEEGRGEPFVAIASTNTIAVGTTEIPIVSVRAAANFNSIENRTQYRNFLAHLTTATQNVLYRIRRNATLGGGSWAAADALSSMEVNVLASTIADGEVIDGFTQIAGGINTGDVTFGIDVFQRLPFGLDIDGANPDTLTLTAQAHGATAAVTAELKWKERR